MKIKSSSDDSVAHFLIAPSSQRDNLYILESLFFAQLHRHSATI